MAGPADSAAGWPMATAAPAPLEVRPGAPPTLFFGRPPQTLRAGCSEGVPGCSVLHLAVQRVRNGGPVPRAPEVVD